MSSGASSPTGRAHTSPPKIAPSIYVGVFLVALAAVALSVVATRLYSAVLGHHFAFLAISLSLLGAGAGAALVSLVGAFNREAGWLARVTVGAGVATIGSVAAGVAVVRMKPIDVIDRASLTELAIVYGVSALPFVGAGFAVATVLARRTEVAARLYFVDMVGAACGGIFALALLQVGALRALFGISLAFGVAALLFAWAGRASRNDASTEVHPALGLAFFLSACSMLAGDIGAPYFRIDSLKYVSLQKAEFVRWNELALVTVDRPVRGMAWMRMDGSAATAIMDGKTRAPEHPDQMSYLLSGEKGPTLVIGAGGGRDVRAALDAKQTRVVAVELNRLIAHDVMLGQFRDFSGGLFARPEVELVVADGRSFVRRTDERFRNIVISLVDTWAASSVGGLALSESGLYTKEAFRDYFEHLTDDGVLVVNRWDGELDRLLALGAAGLWSMGAASPKQHMFACSSARTTALLMKRTELTEAEVAKLVAHCRKQRFTIVVSPDRVANELREALVTSPSAAAERTIATDLTPPTDDRPFFFYSVPPAKLGATLGDRKVLGADQQGLAMLLGVLLVSLVASLVIFVLPLLYRFRTLLGSGQKGARLRTLGFFVSIGIGFILVEVPLVQMLTTFLGHPVYSLTTVLTSLLLSTGLGSFLVARITPDRAALIASHRAQILVILLVVLALGLGPVLAATIGLPLPARILLVLVLVLPIGICMGAQAPLGIVVAARQRRDLVAWCWAQNGFFSVVSASLATLLAMNVGFSVLLLIAAAAYLLASFALPWDIEAGTST